MKYIILLTLIIIGIKTNAQIHFSYSSAGNMEKVKVEGSKYVEIKYQLCSGSSYAGYTKTGIYTDTLTSRTGCDSIRVLNLVVEPAIETSIEETICLGDSFDGYTQSGEYIDVFTTVSGCDSTRLLKLTVTELEVDYKVNIDSVSTVTLNISGGLPPYRYLWDDPEAQTTNPAIGLAAGRYGVTVIDANECSTGLTIDVYTITNVYYLDDNRVDIFPNPFAQSLDIHFSQIDRYHYIIYDLEGREIKSGDLTGKMNTVNVDANSGIYFLKIINRNGASAVFKVVKR